MPKVSVGVVSRLTYNFYIYLCVILNSFGVKSAHNFFGKEFDHPEDGLKGGVQEIRNND